MNDRKPVQIFNAMRVGCKHFSGKWEDENTYGKQGQPVLVFCNHPENDSDVEGNCNEKRCPLLKVYFDVLDAIK